MALFTVELGIAKSIKAKMRLMNICKLSFTILFTIYPLTSASQILRYVRTTRSPESTIM